MKADKIDLTEYNELCELQFWRSEYLRAYVIDPTTENKMKLDKVSAKIDGMVEKALKGLFGEN